ncbi:DUF4437 domain-containing protein [Polaribacter sp. MED152]|uniref:DUF4437 domain-containing protein n=1 Tax=Polaribacter sp. MED152 TaxID=313598 RepID=UPI000068CB9C|nr:DUF4437 domain-containing protein [Polaribacter sp. MED152]EAQ41236.1 hypothetical protein MED152_00940 [Polaribacter sp. MED152]
MKKLILCLCLTVGLLFSCNESKENVDENIKTKIIENPTNKVGLSSDIIWEQMNPAREDKSPLAGTIWGNRKAEVPTGYIGKFKDGFSSPPHIHNVTYRAIVMNGLIHNDDPKSENMWMPVGSFWTQPAGEPHITSAKGEETMAYIEIDNGPYLVEPVTEAFDNGERPINIDASNIVWLDHSQTNWISTNNQAKISFLWKNSNDIRGLFVKLPKNFRGNIYSKGTILYGVIITGNIDYKMPKANSITNLDPGSYFESTGNSIHQISTKEEALIYIRTNNAIEIR